MTTTLIVLAHPDQRSFNGSWAAETLRASEALGHNVILSDLVAMGFDPVERASHYAENYEEIFDTLKAQETASQRNQLSADVAAEINKIRAADRIIFHFPIWWFGPPAILKGWFDRVLANGALHNSKDRFDAGLCKGKKALFCVTTGSTSVESAFDGKEGDVQMLLWPLAYAMRYVGFTVLKPHIVHGVHGYHKGDAKQNLKIRLKKQLAEHQDLIANFDTLAEIPFNLDSEFSREGKLNEDAPSYTHFIRHKLE